MCWGLRGPTLTPGSSHQGPGLSTVRGPLPHFKISHLLVEILDFQSGCYGNHTPLLRRRYICNSYRIKEKTLWTQPVPVSVPKGAGHLSAASSRKTGGQSGMSSKRGGEKRHRQNASPRINGGTLGTFLLGRESTRSPLTVNKRPQSKEILPKRPPSSSANKTKRIQNPHLKGAPKSQTWENISVKMNKSHG